MSSTPGVSREVRYFLVRTNFLCLVESVTGLIDLKLKLHGKVMSKQKLRNTY